MEGNLSGGTEEFHRRYGNIWKVICLEGQRNFTEDICEGKLSLIPDLNSGSSQYAAEVPCVGWNFLFLHWTYLDFVPCY